MSLVTLNLQTYCHNSVLSFHSSLESSGCAQNLSSSRNVLFITEERVVRIVLPIITLTSREGRDPPENGVLTILTVWSKQERLKKHTGMRFLSSYTASDSTI